MFLPVKQDWAGLTQRYKTELNLHKHASLPRHCCKIKIFSRWTEKITKLTTLNVYSLKQNKLLSSRTGTILSFFGSHMYEITRRKLGVILIKEHSVRSIAHNTEPCIELARALTQWWHKQIRRINILIIKRNEECLGWQRNTAMQSVFVSTQHVS